MAIEVRLDEIVNAEAANKQEIKRKRELVRRFADQFVSAPAEITPKWWRVIENYKRLKAERMTHE